jgi:hypothetical protein
MIHVFVRWCFARAGDIAQWQSMCLDSLGLTLAVLPPKSIFLNLREKAVLEE